MTEVLYKVAPPRSELRFYPSRFWHTADWESSTPKPREGYIEDEVLFVGDFDEINIHLLPRKKSVRVRSQDASCEVLANCGLDISVGKTAYLFVHSSQKETIDQFAPTVYAFENSGFENVRKGEYVSRSAKTASSFETLPMAEAIERWNIEICYLEDIEILIELLRKNEIYFDVQT
ncbi:MAG: hypothetical protein ACJAXW_002689 [Candidatus Azotimanducaceae bacterium]|jgi:hypothetical protein